MSGASSPGFLNAAMFGSDLSAMRFLIKMMNGGNFHAHLVGVQSVSNNGGVDAVGSVSVQILTHQIDSSGKAYPHQTIYGVPYFRLQGGASAVIIDPVIGDIGIAVFADRDISSVKASKKAANPGSRRQFDPADALYIGGVLNGIPTQFVQFVNNGGGINVTSPGPIKLNAQGKTWTFGTAGFTMSNAVIAETHVHPQPNDTAGDGEADTDGPINP